MLKLFFLLTPPITLSFLYTISLFAVFCPVAICYKSNRDGSAVAQTSPKPAPQEIVQSGEVRPLPGKLDTIPVFNSNSPEWIKTEGILLSTFPPNGKKVPAAHLNFPFQGRFDLFAHHYTHTPK